MVGTEMKISKQTEISGLAEFAFFETFLYIIYVVFCYQISCFRASLHYVQYNPHSKETKSLIFGVFWLC